MIWWPAKLSPDVRLLLDRERQIAVLPAAARARALSRARSALAAGVATRQWPSRAPSAFRWAAAAGLACVATVAAGAVAYSIGLRARPTAPPLATPPPGEEPRAAHWSAGDEPFRDLLARPVLKTAPARAGAGARVELRLLEKARAAVDREDFALAMQLLADHAHRFRRGRLVEEREALRVKALASLGRRSEARRAAAQFEARFPRSPLLPTVTEMPDLAP
jgi:hypothetical protein